VIQSLITFFWRRGILACESEAEQIASHVTGCRRANIGGGIRSNRWPDIPKCDARINGLDFNTQRLPYADKEYDVVICEQVIEHLHNTTWFLSELCRILKPGGKLLLATENLSSLPNIIALLIGITPFSTQPCCGKFRGGWKRGPAEPHGLALNHPCYSGVSGHVRVMTTNQLRELLVEAGFVVQAVHSFSFRHYILFDATKF
jgi:SAM-dependent methyltransferase